MKFSKINAGWEALELFVAILLLSSVQIVISGSVNSCATTGWCLSNLDPEKGNSKLTDKDAIKQRVAVIPLE